MATESRDPGFPEFLAAGQSAEAVGRHFIEVPLAAAQQSAFESAIELLALMRMLPVAFAASQKNELTRILKTSDEKDPRVVALKSSMEQAALLQATAQRGQARVQRALTLASGALAGGGAGFHGFVSDSNLAPLKGLTVRVTETRHGQGKTFTTTTQDDGFFSIDLGRSMMPPRDPAAKPRPTNVAEWIAELFAARSEAPTASSARSHEPDLFADRSMDAAAGAAPSNADASAGRVEIVKSGTLLYRDPIPVELTAGSIYREYVIADAPPPSGADDRDDVPSDRPRSPREPRPPREPKPPRATEPPPQPSAADVRDVALDRPSPPREPKPPRETEPPRETKPPERSAKSGQPKKKK